MAECFIALGSNLDSPINRIKKAIATFKKAAQMRVTCVSSLYQSAPWGRLEQPDFINAVIQMETTLSAQTLLSELLSIEQQQGRTREIQWGPRTLDCDLLLYDNQCIDEPNLTIPHPRMTERAFVLLPLTEIAPQVLIRGISAANWLLHCDTSQITKINLIEEDL